MRTRWRDPVMSHFMLRPKVIPAERRTKEAHPSLTGDHIPGITLVSPTRRCRLAASPPPRSTRNAGGRKVLGVIIMPSCGQQRWTDGKSSIVG